MFDSSWFFSANSSTPTKHTFPLSITTAAERAVVIERGEVCHCIRCNITGGTTSADNLVISSLKVNES